MTKTVGIAMMVIGAGWWALAAGAASPSTQPAIQPSTQPAKELTLDLGNKVTMKLVLIPAGKFTMGSPETETGRDSDEGPQHEVTISKPFYMGVYEVTQEQYEQVTGKNPSTFKGAKNPVESVSWEEAVEFCKKLSAKTGKTVSLPTEAQWEYACRAGSKTRFGYGNSDADLGDYAWCTTNSYSKTHPVGEKKANAWGLYDMHGNVWEWCSDWYQDSYRNLPTSDSTGPSTGELRIMRGDGWINPHPLPQFCRSALRSWSAPDFRNCVIGFRVAVDLPAGQAGAE